MDDVQIAWLTLGWLLAVWAGRELQARFVQWRAMRHGESVGQAPERRPER